MESIPYNSSRRKVKFEGLCDRLGVSRSVVEEELIALNLMENDGFGSLIPSDHAYRSHVWTASYNRMFGGGEWDYELVLELAQRLGKDVETAPEMIFRNSRDRVEAESIAHRKRLLAERNFAEEAARVRELVLSKMPGLHRVAAMIDARTEILKGQFHSQEDWEVDLRDQLSTATRLSREHSLFGSYPDFESELVDRVVFTLDEQMVASERFVAAGRAQSMPLSLSKAVLEHAHRA